MEDSFLLARNAGRARQPFERGATVGSVRGTKFLTVAPPVDYLEEEAITIVILGHRQRLETAFFQSSRCCQKIRQAKGQMLHRAANAMPASGGH